MTGTGNQPAQNDPPPPTASVQRLPPLGTVEFKAHAIHFCYEAGATLDLARQFYERHEADNWAILEHMPLEVAARKFVSEWKRKDTHAWYAEQFARLKQQGDIERT